MGGGGGKLGGAGGIAGGGLHCGVTSAQLSGHDAIRRAICAGESTGERPWEQLKPRHAEHPQVSK